MISNFVCFVTEREELEMLTDAGGNSDVEIRSRSEGMHHTGDASLSGGETLHKSKVLDDETGVAEKQ